MKSESGIRQAGEKVGRVCNLPVQQIATLPLSVAAILILTCSPNAAQEAQPPDKATIGASIGEDGTGKIIVEARGELPKVPVFYTAGADAMVNVRPGRIEQEIRLAARIIQGKAETLTFGLSGSGEVVSVSGDGIQSWSVRREGEARFLDLRLVKDAVELNPLIEIRSGELELPASVDLTHLAPGKAVGFTSVITLSFAPGVDGTVAVAEGFLPVDADGPPNRFQTTTGGRLNLKLNRSGAVAGPVELADTQLKGEVHSDGRSASFQLRGVAEVTEADAALIILRGNAAASSVPANAGYRLELDEEGKGQPVYRLVFAEPGTYPVQLDFVAVVTSDHEWKAMDFTVGAGAVAPLNLGGVGPEAEFREGTSVVPERRGEASGSWQGFVPATGGCTLAWKSSRKVGEGKLFFSTSARIETTVGAGLLRQNHLIDYKVLQGELDSLTLQLDGSGEVLDVEGENIVGWTVAGAGDARTLEVKLSQAISKTAQLHIRTQEPLDAFPVRVKALRLTPEGAVRHSGYIRLSNQGSVRLEPAGLAGLTQLAPEQFPGEAITARQVFVYRFPAAEHDLEVAADRIQPEVNVSELVLYKVAETDRVINASIELDIREAPVREWDVRVPEDYSVVSVTGAALADYVVGSEVEDGRRTLKVIFGQDVAGRQLVELQLEKSEAAAAGDWVLPRLEFPDAKSVRGDIGIVGAPGIRIAAGPTDLLVEKPLSYFPNPVPNLQQAFRIREPGWSATMRIELLEKNIQADVFHLYSLSEGTAYGSVLLNYFVTGAPVSEWEITVPEDLGNVLVEGKDVRTWRREGESLIVSLHQPVIGSYTLLVTFEEKLDNTEDRLQPGRVIPAGVEGERGYLQVVSPMQVKTEPVTLSDGILKLDALELPAEFRLLTSAPPLGTWQYTERPFELVLTVDWFEPGTTVTQVVEFSDVDSRVSPDGELVTDLLYYVKSRGHSALKLELPDAVRLWAVTVAGRSVSAREAGKATLIPLPGGTDPNLPVEVKLTLGKPAVNGRSPVLALPRVSVPVLKTEWRVRGDEKHVLVPSGGTVEPPTPILPPSGFSWVVRKSVSAFFFIALFAGAGIRLTRKAGLLRFIGLVALSGAIIMALVTAMTASRDSASPAPLSLSLPVLSADEAVHLEVQSVPLWRANLSWLGMVAVAGGIGWVLWSFLPRATDKMLVRTGGALLVALGVLLQRAGAPWFFILLALAIFALLFLPRFREWIGGVSRGWKERRAARKEKKKRAKGGDIEPGAATASVLAGALCLLAAASNTANAQAVISEGFNAANAIQQEWRILHEEDRLQASGVIRISGRPGERFLLLKAPAVLTSFEGKGLRLTKQEISGQGLAYVVSIPADPAVAQPEFEAKFEFQLEVKDVAAGFPLPTGPAAVQRIDASYDRSGWEFVSPAAVKIEPADAAGSSRATLLLAPRQNVQVSLKPKARDVTAEETQFYVEGSNLYLPGPGVVGGRHRVHVRPSQGQVQALAIRVPEGLTVSEVSGPVGSWQFDAETRVLQLAIEPAQAQAFDVGIDTQRGLDPLPSDASLAPLRVDGAAGEVGLLAIAFGPDAQPERADSETMSAVNLGDFDTTLLPSEQFVLHRVYRYGADGGELALRVAPVAPEVRVTSKQVLSLGDERIVLGINFVAEITRAGLFQISFPLPDGLEVESLTGAALHHWAELTEGEQRQIILHLNGKTIGVQNFSLTLTGAAPADAGDWEIPRFELKEATRQSGDLVVKPTTGIRLRTISRQNLSEVDPRTLGGDAQGALAFRLLQRDWNLVLGIEKLDPWVTGQVLHEVTLREGQTRTALMATFNVQNASIRSLQVKLPVSSDDEIKTLRSSGASVSDLVRTAPDSDIWEIQFKRRVVGDMQVRIEFERRGDRADETEMLAVAEFPEARQLSYHFAVRAGGRLELEPGELTRGWQRADWNAVPKSLREAGNRNAPALTLRAVAPEEGLGVLVLRHSLKDALKLRVDSGSLTTVLSPLGDQLSAVDLRMEVIQRASLTVGLPEGGELFSIFVNGESVHSVRQGDGWQFYILPGADDRFASVRFVYSVSGKRLRKLDLTSPQLNVPLENIQWRVVAPKGFELTDDRGNLELLATERRQSFDKNSYLSKAQGNRQAQAAQAAQLLEQANQFLQAGEQKKAGWALNSVANQYALDAASNEDARVQLENLQTQQAIVGLNTRRQRLYLDNNDMGAFVEDEQLKEGAIDKNRVLQDGDLNFRPQELSQLLQGNTSEDNAVLQRIAGRLVKHQRTTEPAPQAITITLPEEGTVYSFGRTVQVAENAPLELRLRFDSVQRLGFWRIVLVLALLAALAGTLVFSVRRKEA